MEEFHTILKMERLKRSLSQEELAEKIGTTYVNINRWERGKHQPTHYFRRKLCEFFAMSLQELMPGSISSTHTDARAVVAPSVPAEERNALTAKMPFAYKMKLINTKDFFGRKREIR